MDLQGIRLPLTHLEGSNVKGANLSRANLESAYLQNSDLGFADLRSANLLRAYLFGTNIEGANFENADLGGVFLTGRKLTGANFRGASFRFSDLKGADLSGNDLRGAALAGANLVRANLQGADLRGADLQGANVADANLQGANLEDTRLGSADLRGADLSGADLRGADLEEANLEGANLRDANLEGANLEGANLEGANLEGANLQNAILYTASMETIKWDARTIWPKGYAPLAEHLTFSDPTGSEAFRRWFGDSVVKDETGRPVVVYHGTRDGRFTAFDLAQADAHHPGFYFTDDILTANSYIGKKVGPLLDPADRSEYAHEGVYRLYLKMERPFVHDAKGATWKTLDVPEFPDAHRTFEVAHAAKATGRYDGVIFRNILDSGGRSSYKEPADVYVVFDPRNIKSATANVGTYDPNDPDIRRNPRRSFNPRPSRGARSTRKPKGRR